MAELIPAGAERRTGTLSERIARLKDALSFGECATAAGLRGSSRAGWECPACGAPETVRERTDHRGARCGACGKGYDGPGIYMTTRGASAWQAVLALEGHLREREARKAGASAGNLFEEERKDG